MSTNAGKCKFDFDNSQEASVKSKRKLPIYYNRIRKWWEGISWLITSYLSLKMRCVTKKIKHIVFIKVTRGHIDFMKQKELFTQKKKKFNAPKIALVHQYGRRFRSWSHNVACHDVMWRQSNKNHVGHFYPVERRYMDRRRRALWLGRSHHFFHTYVVSNNHQTSPTNTHLLVDSTANFPIEIIWRTYDASKLAKLFISWT